MQVREGIKLSPCGSIKDTILSRVLVNERIAADLETLIMLSKGKTQEGIEALKDLVLERSHRLLNKEHEFFMKKAYDTLKLNSVLDDAKQYM